MKIDYIRSSCIGTYTDCEWKYYLEYLCGVESIANFAALKGTMVHCVGELLARSKKTGRHLRKDKYNDYNYLLDIVWKRFNKTHGKIFPGKFTHEDYEFCKENIEFILSSKFSPLKLEVLQTELQFEIALIRKGFDSDFKLRGTIDLITTPNSHTLHGIDWKTGLRKNWQTGKVKEYEDFQKDIQIRIYDLALYTLYPSIPDRLFTVFYTRDGGPFTVSFSDKDREDTLESLRQHCNAIKRNKNPKRLKDDPSRSSEKWKCFKICQHGKTGTCDTYYRMFDRYNMHESTAKIAQLSIEGRMLDISPRNDYTRNKIQRGVLVA